MVEFEPANSVTRLDVYKRLSPMCERLVVAFKEIVHLTTGSENTTTTGIEGAALCWLTDVEADEPTARNKMATSLCGVVPEFRLTAVHNWHSLVERLTCQDISAEVKDVAWTELHMRFKLWWLILNENVRSLRSTNSRMSSLLVDNPGAKAILKSLLNEYRIRSNRSNTMRLDYQLCQSVVAADDEIRCSQSWAEQVLDWFAQRLPQPELNRRSLYLWGPAGVGKSRLISRLLAGRMCSRRDCCEGFFLQDLAERRVRIRVEG
jgi:hypothetical protein